MPTAPRSPAAAARRQHRRRGQGLSPLPLPLVLLALFLTTAFAAAAPTTKPVAAGDDDLYLHVHGAGDNFWLSAPDVGPDRKPVTLLFARDTAGRWNYLTDLADVVTGLSDYHNDLVAVLRNGSWRTVYDGGSAGGAAPASGKITHLAGDADSLYALVRTPDGRYQLQRLGPAPIAPPPPAPTSAPATAPAATTQQVIASTQPTTRAEPVPTAPAWSVVADLPAEIAQDKDAALAIAVVDDKLYLAGVLADKRVAVYVLTDSTLKQLAAFAPADAPLELKVLALGRRPAVWVSPATTNGGAVYTAPAFDPAKRIPLGPINGEAAVSSGRIRLLHAEDPKKPDGGRTMESTWDFSGAKKSDAPIDLPLTTGPVSNIVTIALWGIIGIAAVASLRRGMTRQVLFNALHLPLASRTKRFAAGAIDSAPFFLTTFYLLARRGFPTDPYSLALDPTFELAWSIGLAVAVLQPLVLESLTGRSVGKFLFGLRVLGLDGAPARPGPVILRNLLRLIEYPLALLLLTVLFTPLRQRLGDTLAGTVVTDDNKPPQHIDETA